MDEGGIVMKHILDAKQLTEPYTSRVTDYRLTIYDDIQDIIVVKTVAVKK